MSNQPSDVVAVTMPTPFEPSDATEQEFCDERGSLISDIDLTGAYEMPSQRGLGDARDAVVDGVSQR